MKVHLRHLRAVGYCAPGVRLWLEQRGFCWKEFAQSGLDVSVFELSGDAQAVKLAEVARAEKK